jgi:hypothetical protein
VVYLLLFISIEYAVWVQENSTYQHTTREVIVADVKMFAVRDSREAYYLLQQAIKSREVARDEVKTYNSRQKYNQWEMETQWRIDCWWCLYNALTKPVNKNKTIEVCGDVTTITYIWGWSNYDRILALEQLKSLIGDEAFYAGKMPNPMPTYHYNPR